MPGADRHKNRPRPVEPLVEPFGPCPVAIFQQHLLEQDVDADAEEIAWIQNRFMETPMLRAAFQVVLGGALVFAAGVLIGSG